MKAVCTALVLTMVLTQAAQANVITKGVREIIEAIVKKGGKEATQELAEYGGKKAIQEVLEKAAKEGGDKLVNKVIRYGRKYGLSAVKTIDNAPALYVKCLDEIPESLVERAIWAAQREPAAMTRLLSKHGSDALQIAARYRGVGTDIIAKLGDDGIRMARKLNESQAVVLARHADEIAALPAPQRNQVVDAIFAAPGKAIDIMESHPTVFLTAAGIGTLIALKEETLGKDEEIIINPDGSRRVRKRGFLERVFGLFLKPISAVIVVIACFIGGWGIVKIWGAYRRERVKISRDEFRFQNEKKKLLESQEQSKDATKANNGNEPTKKHNQVIHMKRT